jgi:hypothetical protein
MSKLPRPKAFGGIGKPTTIKAVKNKGSHQMRLPSPAALRQLSKGDPVQTSMGNFAKLTPSGATALAMPYSGIMAEGQQPETVPGLDSATDE